MQQKLNHLKEKNENIKFELKTDEDNYNSILIIVNNFRNKRCNIQEELLQLVVKDKQKITHR